LVNYRRRGGRGRLYGSAGEGTKTLFHKGFSSFYALVTTYYTYPEPTPVIATAARRVTQTIGRHGAVPLMDLAAKIIEFLVGCLGG
jgi:hypothetical protein